MRGGLQCAGYNRYALQSNVRWGECAVRSQARDLEETSKAQMFPVENIGKLQFRGADAELPVGLWGKVILK